MRKSWIFMLLLIAAAGIVLCNFPRKVIVEVGDVSGIEAAGISVVLNEYAPEKWNGGYGHYDLTFDARDDERFICRLNGERVECGEITLSYGATEGDESPARVHLYTDARTDHRPAGRMTVYESLSYEDFNDFMCWFMGYFARYERMDDDGVYVFRVDEDAFEYYSLTGEKNCITAAMRMLEELPGIADVGKNDRAGTMEQLEMFF